MLKKKNYDVYGFDSSSDKPGFSSNFLKGIRSPSVTENEKLADFLIDYKKRLFDEIKPVLIPASDEYVQYICKYETLLSAYFNFLIPDHSTIEGILNKEKQLSLISGIGIKVPVTYEIKNIESSNVIFGNLNFPVIIKPADTGKWKKHFLVKAFKVSNKDEYCRKVKEALGYGLKVIVQEIIPGDCTNNFEVSTYVNKEGVICGLFTIKKIRQYPMEFGYGCLVETCSNKTVEDLTVKILIELKWKGFANFEFKFDSRTGEYYFIEVNPRVWQQIELPYEAGKVNYPELHVDDLNCKKLPNIYKFKEGIKWIDIFADILSSVSLMKKGKLTLSAWKNSVKNTKKYGLASLKDPMPIIKDMNYGLRLILAPLKLLRVK